MTGDRNRGRGKSDRRGSKAAGRSQGKTGNRRGRTASAAGRSPAQRQPRAARDQPARPAADLPAEKLQKLLARAGIGSRRAMETAISAGRVAVNGAVAGLGDRATVADNITLDGRVVSVPEPDSLALPRVLVYNKPIGEVCTRSDPEGRRTCFESLPARRGGRWVAVGRLDLTTSGLLLFTDSGEFANRLMHPSANLDREYAARVAPEPTDEQVAALRAGVELDDGPARFTDIQSAGGTGVNRWYHVALMEGRNREVRRLWESQGLTVSRLKRVRFGPVVMPSVLRVGKWMDLDLEEIAALAGLVGHALPQAELVAALRRAKQQRISGKAAGKRRAPTLLPYPGMEFKAWR